MRTRRVAENTVGRLPPGLLLIYTLAFQSLRFLHHMLTHKVILKAFIQRCHLLYCFIQPANRSRQRITEQAADASGNINTRTLQFI